MPKVLNVYLFILCVISYQGIFGTSLDENIGKLSHIVREKRVISRDPNEDVPAALRAFPYVVNIKMNNRMVGVGTIVSPHTAITAAGIFVFETRQYTVTSGSIYSFLGAVHNVTDTRTQLSRPHRREIGITLVYVDPPFEGRNIETVGLHTGPVLAGMHGTVIGWACSVNGRQQSQHPRKLRAITVPIMSHRECLNIYRNVLSIREEELCTYHEQKQCGDTDAGAPLVIDNELAGIHIHLISTSNELTIKPDIFILLQHEEYREWIKSHIVL